MIDTLLSRLFAAGLLAACCISVHAQQPVTPTTVTVQVRGLSSATRDAVVNELKGGPLKVAFACVPAGILVFESTAPAARGELREQALAKAGGHLHGQDVRELNIGREQAENLCAEARNR